MTFTDLGAAFRALEALYAELQAELDALGPRCRLTGRCCHFKDTGHQLWGTRLEIEYLLDRAGPPGSIPDGVCPYLRDDVCGARKGRLLACRTFFCEASFRHHMGPIYEKYHRRVRDLHRLAGFPYEYYEILGELARRKARPPAPGT